MHLDDKAVVCIPCWNNYPQVLQEFTDRLVVSKAKLEVRIQQTRTALASLAEYVEAGDPVPSGALQEVEATLEGEKPATAEELVQGTQSLSFEEMDDAAVFIPLAVDKTYEKEDALLRPSQRPLRCVDCHLTIDWDEDTEPLPERCQGCYETHKLHEEIARLRDALDDIAGGKGKWCTYCTPIARAALKEKL